MGLFGDEANGSAGANEAAAQQRQDAWAHALKNNRLPDFVERRLNEAATRKAPWLSTMTPAELLLGRSHGLRPLATVSGTCWYHYGFSWTRGHADGWNSAISRLKREALAAGANAVVDVKMRKIDSPTNDSMDFTLLGTAVKFDALPPSSDPVVASVSALDFVRLLEAGIAVCGIAVGAAYDFLENSPSGYPFNPASAGPRPYGYGVNAQRLSFQVQQQLRTFGGNTPVRTLTAFWETIRRRAHMELRRSASRIGNGVLAKIHFGELLRVERDPPDYLGRHIVIGTVIETKRGDRVPHHIKTVVDMRDELSPLIGGQAGHNDFQGANDQEGGI